MAREKDGNIFVLIFVSVLQYVVWPNEVNLCVSFSRLMWLIRFEIRMGQSSGFSRHTADFSLTWESHLMSKRVGTRPYEL